MSTILFEEFEKINKETWIAKIKENINDQNIDSFYYNPEESIEIDPFTHHEDNLAYRPLTSQKKLNEWSIGEHIEIKDSVEEANREILDSLNMGANSLIINFPDHFNQFDKLFIDVDLSMIRLRMEFMDVHHFFDNPFWKKEKEHLKAYINFRATSVNRFSSTDFSDFPLVKFLLLSSNQQVTINQLAEILVGFQKIIDDNSSNMVDACNRIFLELELGKVYFLEIAKIRALHILFANILSANDLDIDKIPEIIAYPKTDLFTNDYHENMIRMTTMLMSGILGGASILYTPIKDAKDRPEMLFLKRIARNVQNIIMLESFFDKVGDPSAGSYYLEHLTDQIVLKSWKEFTKRISV